MIVNSSKNYFNNHYNCLGWNNYLNITELFAENENSKVALIEDNKLVISFNIRIYKYKGDNY